MMKETILKTACALKQPGLSSAQEFGLKWENLSARGTQVLMERPDAAKLTGKGNQDMAQDNNRNFPRFMASLFLNYQPRVLVETVLWVFCAYRAHGFATTYWAANLNIWVDLLKKELTPGAFAEIYPFYDWLIVNIPAFVRMSDPEISGHE